MYFESNMKNILLLQTGGTIAMHLNQSQTELDQDKWTSLLQKEIPELFSIAAVHVEKIFFKDSSDINHTHWKTLSNYIYNNYGAYDGFVILHGTDTMAYTASALSFALQNLKKPVILTGSQVPLSNIRSDARRNLVNSIELATHQIPEVAICFNDHLFRGNRSTKMNIGDFDAFTSPNFRHLAEIGLDIEFYHQWEMNDEPVINQPYFDDALSLIKIYPGLNPGQLDCIDLGMVKAVVVEAFGTGNFPLISEYSLLPFIRACREAGVHVIITSQAPYDSVNLSQYKSGREAKRLGVLSAGDMTIEATITKIMFLLGRRLADDQFIEQFTMNISGERSR
jgi:L-asparaginase